jgi:hypothetical protein
MRAGHFSGHQPDAFSYMIWGTVHGMVALEIRDRCKGINCTDMEKLTGGAFDSFLKVLEKV